MVALEVMTVSLVAASVVALLPGLVGVARGVAVGTGLLLGCGVVILLLGSMGCWESADPVVVVAEQFSVFAEFDGIALVFILDVVGGRLLDGELALLFWLLL